MNQNMDNEALEASCVLLSLCSNASKNTNKNNNEERFESSIGINSEIETPSENNDLEINDTSMEKKKKRHSI